MINLKYPKISMILKMKKNMTMKLIKMIMMKKITTKKNMMKKMRRNLKTMKKMRKKKIIKIKIKFNKILRKLKKVYFRSENKNLLIKTMNLRKNNQKMQIPMDLYKKMP